jgi:hypothetical protein
MLSRKWMLILGIKENKRWILTLKKILHGSEK